jgi:hypothetical protein
MNNQQVVFKILKSMTTIIVQLWWSRFLITSNQWYLWYQYLCLLKVVVIDKNDVMKVVVTT